MTYSMTAFGQAILAGESGDYVCEMRTVNHRFLEVHLRLPDELRAQENQVREQIAGKLKRGRVDCFIKKSDSHQNLDSMSVNQDVVRQLQSIADTAQQAAPNTSPLRMIDVLRWPGVMVASEVDETVQQKELGSLIDTALGKVIEARGREGEKLAGLIHQRVDAMREIVDSVGERLPEIKQQYRERLEEKLEAVKEDMDESRLEQEMVIFLQKSDVMEELDRLRVHFKEVETTLKSTKPKGRRLDFLMQELNREANTLGSKSHDSELTQYAVELKVLIEQMREQVQNIE